jgi:hypothetical protein
MGKRARLKNRARLANGRANSFHFDATPERLAKGDASEFINPAIIDSAEQPIGRARRFHKMTRIDRWHRGGVITQRQFMAADQYRTLHARAISVPRVVASYGEATSGGETDYGMARTAAQARARSRFRAARSNIPVPMLGFIDGLILHDNLPDYRGRAQMRTFTQARQALDMLADHFDRPC